MTLILGINLNQQIYLSSDTRLSDKGSKQIITDDIQKFEIINNEVVVEVAGDLTLTKFLISEFTKEHFRKRDINYVRKKIEKWIRKKLEEFLKLNNKEGYTACLLFGGLSRGSKEYPSRLFAILIDTRPVNLMFKIEDALDGQFLVFGSGILSKDNLDDVNKNKLEEISKKEQSFEEYITLLTAITTSMAEKKNVQSIGGSVVPFRITSRGIEMKPRAVFRVKVNDDGSLDQNSEFLSEITVINGELNHKSATGVYKPLISFLEYDLAKNESLNL